MSKKTLLKRIALVAVSAMGFGLLVTTPGNAAASYSGGVTYSSTALASTTVTGGIGTAATGSTICKMTAYDGTTDLSLGASSNYGATNDLASIVIPVGGQIQILVPSTSDVLVLQNMAGEAILEDTTANTVTVNGTTFTAAAPADAVFLKATAVGSGTLVNKGTGSTVLTSVSISVVASCANSVWSVSKSGINIDDEWASTPVYTSGDQLVFEAGSDAYINLLGRNSYNQVLGSATWSASATNGATVLFGDTTAIDATTTAAGTVPFATGTYDGDGSGNTGVTVRVTPADAAVASKTTVTITYGSTTVLTKELTFLGEATKINIIGNYSGTVGGTNGLLLFTLTDAAGNQVPGDISLDSTTATSRTNTFTELNDATPLSPTTNSPDSYALGSHTYGAETFNCVQSAGTGSSAVTVKHTSAVNAATVTASVTLKCAGGVDTYSLSMDKASYSIGEIATITITAKDSTGAAVSDMTTVGSGVDITFGGATITKAAATTDTFTNGVKTYKAQVTTAGSFNAVVNIAGTTTKSATVGYTVTGGGVSNAEVLAAIVSLIASINKQIAKLQKLIKK